MLGPRVGSMPMCGCPPDRPSRLVWATRSSESGQGADSLSPVRWRDGFLARSSELAGVARPDEPLTASRDVRGRRRERAGRFLALELRYHGPVWGQAGNVHVERCAAEP